MSRTTWFSKPSLPVEAVNASSAVLVSVGSGCWITSSPSSQICSTLALVMCTRITCVPVRSSSMLRFELCRTRAVPFDLAVAPMKFDDG